MFLWRWWFFLGLGGLALLVHGVREVHVATQVSDVPTPIAIAALEAGQRPDQPWVELGDHLAAYGNAVAIEAGSQRRFAGALYPVVSEGHDLAKAWARLDADSKQVPRPSYVEVFVLRRDFASRDAIPPGCAPAGPVRGIARPGTELEGEELAALYDLMHGTGPTEVVVIEAGREPEGAAAGIVTIFASIIVLNWALQRFRRDRRIAREPGTAAPFGMAR